MYLSLLRLNSRSRRALTESSRPYELHRSLLKAFPDNDEGGTGRVLFRLDTDDATGGMSVLVQSEKEPTWNNLNGFKDFVTDCKCKEFLPEVKDDQVLRFRLRANPAKRSKQTGKREGILKTEDQIAWLEKKGEKGGFEILDVNAVNEGYSRDGLTDSDNEKHTTTMLSVRYDGLLRVIDADTFHETLRDGIGPAKGFGFGLLSIAPARG
ncbi:MAG: type I-E CRISPR-associated protein Cas6/Cse3/CasE [Dehalococcoidales bacterium]|nr:type I-E CRISPR-associated protein Cas6/Cse3/CasE [Dehalococcoidales bacterium]